MVKIILNGNETEVKADSSLTDLLKEYKLDPQVVIIEKNGTIIEKSAYNDEKIALHDKIELIRFMGGG